MSEAYSDSQTLGAFLAASDLNVPMATYFVLLAISFITALPGIIGWARAAGQGPIKVFRIGPALLVPPVMLLTAVSAELCPSYAECIGDLWRISPFYVAVIVSIVWLSVLIYMERPMGPYLLYAAVYLPAFYLYCMFMLAIAVRAPL